MTWAGFVESRRGAKGGFWLVVLAGHIRVTDVAAFFAHHSPEGPKHSGDAVVRALAPATARWEKEVGSITVADIAKLERTRQTKKANQRKGSSARTRCHKKGAGTT
jgi:DNA-binding IscR family transcriptional regulator